MSTDFRDVLYPLLTLDLKGMVFKRIVESAHTLFRHNLIILDVHNNIYYSLTWFTVVWKNLNYPCRNYWVQGAVCPKLVLNIFVSGLKTTVFKGLL